MTNNVQVDWIAERKLEIADQLPVRQVTISIGRPRLEPQGEWACPYRIDGLGDSEIYEVSGVDGLHSIQCALVVIAGALAGTNEGRRDLIRWLGKADLGFK